MPDATKGKKALETAIAVIGMVNTALPPALNLILSLRREDGTLVNLDKAEGHYNDNLEEAKKWIAENPD